MASASIQQIWRLRWIWLLAASFAGASDPFRRCRNLFLNDNPDAHRRLHHHQQQDHVPALVSSPEQQQLLSQNATENSTAALLPVTGQTQIIGPDDARNHPLDEYRDSTCQRCGHQDFLTQQQPKSKETNFDLNRLRLNSNKTHAVILLESSVMQEKFLSIAAGLLTFGHPVTFVTGPAISQDHSFILDLIFQQIPCDRHQVALNLIGFKRIVVADPSVFPCPAEMLDPTRNSPGDVILCSMQNSVPIAAALNAQLRTIFLPVVLIFDATSVAGLLVAERELIPSVVLVENGSAFLRHILGTPGNQQHRASSRIISPSVLHPGYWLSAISSGIQDRLNAIDLTNAFVQLNKIRNYLNMKRVRHVADLWRAGGSLMLVTDEFDLSWQNVLPNLLLMPSPVLPTCIPCTDSPTGPVSNNTIPTIVASLSFSNDDEGQLTSRRLMHGLEIARQSIRSLVWNHEACDDEGFVERGLCWSGPSDFQVVPILPDDTSDPSILLPDFYGTPETQFLDSVARHQPVAIVTVCNTTNNWIRKLGPPVLCLNSAWKPREIAFRLMNLWHNGRNSRRLLSAPASSSEMDGLEWIVVLVEQIGILKISVAGRLWQNGWEMGRGVLNHVKRRGLVEYPDEKEGSKSATKSSPFDSLIVLLAWIVLACATLYIPLRDASYVQRFRARRLNQLRTNHDEGFSLSAHVNYFCLRLPELDRTWDQWGGWMSNQLSSWDETFVSSGGSSAAKAAVVKQGTFHARRKRTTAKKQH